MKLHVLLCLLAITHSVVSHMPTVYEFCSHVVANGGGGRATCDASQCQGRPGKLGPVGPRGFRGIKGEKGDRGGSSEELEEQVRLLQDLFEAMRRRLLKDQSLKNTSCHLGMKSREIPDSAMQSSSEWDANHSPRFGRMDNQPGNGIGAWCPRQNRKGEWIQVDLGRPKLVAGLVTQGRPRTRGLEDPTQWVKSYKVSCGASPSNLETIRENGTDKIFIANVDRESKVVNMFPKSMSCRYVRIYPQAWSYAPCMRFELIDGLCFDIY